MLLALILKLLAALVHVSTHALIASLLSIFITLMQLRDKGVFDITEVEFALLEPNGELSVLKKSQYNPVSSKDLNSSTYYKGLMTELIIDGRVISQHLQVIGKDTQWLFDQLKSRNIYNIKDVVLAGFQTDGQLFVSLKNDTTGIHSIF